MTQNAATMDNSRAISAPVREVLTKAFTWMLVAMILATIGALAYSRFDFLQNVAMSQPVLTIVLLIAWLIFSIGLGPLVKRVPASIGAVLLMIYALVTGVFLAPVLAQYTTASLALALGATVILFASMTVLALVTKMDLRKPRFFIWAGSFAFIIFGVINALFIRSEALEWLISLGLIVLFSVSVASSVQTVVAMVEETATAEHRNRLSIVGAAILFTSFLNILLAILRAFGQKR